MNTCAVRPDSILKTVDYEINLEVAAVARIFNKTLGKISRKNAIEIIDGLDYKHLLSYEIAKTAVSEFFADQPEYFYRTDGIVGNLQSELAGRGYKITKW